MRPFTSTISLDEARRRLADAVVPIDRTERVGLDEAAGRVAAASVRSSIDVPPFPRSAMDGYAVLAADTIGTSRAAPRRLRLVDRIFTGQPSSTSITTGTCAEISTGAPIPSGADAVVMVEETAKAEESGVDVFATAAPGQNVSPRAADIAAGSVVVQRGDALTPSRIGALAAVGSVDIEVFARPRVAILSTGNEVVEPGRPLGPGQIYDVNRFTLSAIVAAHGGVAAARAPVHDTIEALVAAVDSCLADDLIVFSGGSSVGERDLTLDLVRARGTMIFHGIAVKPGKPTAFAILAGTPFFGMPGNPTSCLSNAYILLIPFLRAVARLPAYAPRTVDLPLARRVAGAAGRHTFYTVRIVDGVAWPAFKGSGDITSLSQADGYIEIAADRAVIDEGTAVEVTLF